MQSTRIGVITFDWYPSEPRSLRLTRAAIDAGYAVDVICLQGFDQKLQELDGNPQIYRIPLRS
jgi:hypothetical protein